MSVNAIIADYNRRLSIVETKKGCEVSAFKIPEPNIGGSGGLGNSQKSRKNAKWLTDWMIR